MGFKCGIVGLPNVGKSTLFNALTKAKIEAANYPFTTIDPNIGVVPIPDPRLDAIAKIAKSKQVIPTTVQFVDIAGLVKGAAKGEGLGNKFLANIRETQAIAHVVRCFESKDIAHISGKVDPIADIDIIDTELMLADMQTIDKALLKTSKDAKRGDKDAIARQSILEKLKAELDQGKPMRSLQLDEDTLNQVQTMQLLTMKPVLYIANVDDKDVKSNPYYKRVEDFAQAEGSRVVPICAAIEAEMIDLEEDEQQELLASMGLEEPGLHRVIHSGYELLGLQTYFTAGPKESRAWTVPIGVTASQAAGVIHSDFEKGFIRAEVIGYKDYIKYQGEQGAKEAGKWRLEGKEYIVQDGDVMLFRFNV